MPRCTNPGCDKETRGRRFNVNDNGKIYYEKKCRSCENTMRRYGMTSPERKAEQDVLRGFSRTDRRRFDILPDSMRNEEQ